jgi:hypothetical protein
LQTKPIHYVAVVAVEMMLDAAGELSHPKTLGKGGNGKRESESESNRAHFAVFKCFKDRHRTAVDLLQEQMHHIIVIVIINEHLNVYITCTCHKTLGKNMNIAWDSSAIRIEIL